MTPVAEAVATFTEQVARVAGERVSSRRQGQHWRLSFHLGSRQYSLDEHALRVGGKTAGLAGGPLRIVRCDYNNGKLLLILEATQVLAEAARDLAESEKLVSEADQLLRGLSRDPLRTAFARRALRGIGRVARESSSDAIAAATEAPTDTEVVFRALEQPEILQALSEDDPLLPAKLRGLRERERLLSLEGGTWSTEQVAKHLHLTRQGVNRRRRTGTLLGIDVGRRGFRYPAWQFVRSGSLPGLENILGLLRDHDAWMQLSFMLNANARLDGETPLDALRAGERAQVEEAARAFGEHGAP